MRIGRLMTMMLMTGILLVGVTLWTGGPQEPVKTAVDSREVVPREQVLIRTPARMIRRSPAARVLLKQQLPWLADSMKTLIRSLESVEGDFQSDSLS